MIRLIAFGLWTLLAVVAGALIPQLLDGLRDWRMRRNIMARVAAGPSQVTLTLDGRRVGDALLGSQRWRLHA